MAMSVFGPTLFFLMLANGLMLPAGVTPGPGDPALAAAAPADCLFYLNWNGTAPVDPKTENATERLASEPEVKQLIAGLEKAIRGAIRRSAGGGPGGPGGPGGARMEVIEDVMELARAVFSRPGAVYVSKVEMGENQPPKVGAAAVLSLGDEMEKAKAALNRLLASVPPGVISEVEVAGAKWQQFALPGSGPAVVWGTRDKHFIVAVGEEKPAAILARLGGKPPEWLADIDTRLAVPRRSTLAYLNIKAIVAMTQKHGGPQVAGVLAALGIDRVGSIAQVSGLDETGSVSRGRVAIEPGAKGIFAALSEKPLTPADLAPIPRDATFALAAKVDADRIWNTILAIVGRIEPRAAAELDRQMGEAQNAMDLDLRDDLLRPLGDVWCLYNSPGDGGFLVTGVTLVVRVKDAARLSKTHERLLARIKAEMQQHGDSRRGPAIVRSVFGNREVFTLMLPEPPFPFAPSWCLTDKELIVALAPQTVKAYLTRPATVPTLAQAPEVARLFEEKKSPLCVTYVDAAQWFQVLYPLVQIGVNYASGELRREGFELDPMLMPSARAIAPHLRPSVGAVYRTDAGIESIQRQTLPAGGGVAAAPVLVGLGLPAVQAARAAAARAQSTNNMKQIGLALHNYADTFRTFPPAYSTDRNGKPLLSWRVHILPFIEQEALYRQFHLDEPWDSAHNKPLSQVVVATYRSPNMPLPPGKTMYLAIRDDRSIFPGARPIRFADITDGTSNTIMVVEANVGAAVEWTRPDDLPLDTKQPARGLGGARPGGFLALMGDGSVQFVSAALPAQTLTALFTRNGSEVVSFPLHAPPPMPPQLFPGAAPRPKMPGKIMIKSAPTRPVEKAATPDVDPFQPAEPTPPAPPEPPR